MIHNRFSKSQQVINIMYAKLPTQKLGYTTKPRRNLVCHQHLDFNLNMGE